MNEPVKLNKTAEGKFSFDSQQHYDQALESMIANPSSMTDLQALMNLDNVVLNTANSGQPLAAAQPQAESAAPAKVTPPAAVVPSATPQGLIERLRQKAQSQGLNFSYENEDHIIDGIIQKEKHIKFLKEQRSSLVTKEEYDKALKEKIELEERLKKFHETAPSIPAQGQPAAGAQVPGLPPGTPASKRPEIDLVRKKLKEIDDPLSEESASLQRQLNDLVIQELERVESIRLSTGNQDNSEVLTMVRDIRKELKELKEKGATDEAEAQIQRQYQNDLKAVEGLQTTHPEFKSSLPLKEMDVEYRNWASELFFLRHKRKPSSVAEMNLIVQDYLNDDVELGIMAKQAGIEEPKDTRTYLKICDLLKTRDQLDASAGREHTLEQVLVYKMAIDGTINDAMAQQRQLGAQAIKHGQQQRDADYARQLDHIGGGSPEQVGDEMPLAQALEIMNKITPERAARNPADKALFEKASAAWRKHMLKPA